MIHSEFLADQAMLVLAPAGPLAADDFTRIAAVTDGGVLAVQPRIAKHFVAAEVRHFEYADRDAALRWLATGTDRARDS